jgi:hypothetical protein
MLKSAHLLLPANKRKTKNKINMGEKLGNGENNFKIFTASLLAICIFSVTR